MRILFLSHYYPPEVNAPAARTSEHCRQWVKAGHEVTVVTCVPNCPDGVVFGGYRNRLRSQVEMQEGVRVVRVWTYVAPNSGTIRRVINYVSYLLSAVWTCLWLPQPDVVIATSPQFFCGRAGVWVSWLKRCPFVLEIRDIWPESIAVVGAMKRGLVLRSLEWLEQQMYCAADHIVAVGAGYRDEILRKADVGDRISVIMNGVDLEHFDPNASGDTADPRSRWNLGNRFVCSYIGTMGMAHGLEIVLNAADLLKQQGRDDVVFLLVGDGARRKELEEQARQRGLNNWIVFTGRQRREDVPMLLAASDACLVHLQATELFGTVVPSKIFETMAMQRPIIMGVRGEALQIVLDAGAGLPIEPESASDLVAAIEQLSGDDDRREAMGVAGRAYVAAHFSRNVLAQEYLELLGDVAGRPTSWDDERPPPPPLVRVGPGVPTQ